MKKHFTLVALLVLNLSTLACRLPFFNRALDPPVASTEETALEEPTSLAQEPNVPEEAAPKPTALGEISADTQVLKGNGIEIALPVSYVLGDAEKDLPVLVEGLQALSEDSGQDMQALYEQNKDDIILWGYDAESSAEHMTSLLILKNEEFAGMPLTILSVFANTLLGDEVESLSQERLKFGGRDALRFLSTAGSSIVENAQAIYLFNEAGKLWVIGFFTNQAQIDQQLPTFDAAVASITILPAE